jgi:hypothetical protein
MVIGQEMRIPTSIAIDNGDYDLNGKLRPGVSTACYEESRDLLKSLKQYLKENHELKVSINSSGLIGEELISTSLSDKHFSFYAIVKEEKLFVWMAFGTDIYVTPNEYPEENKNLSNLVEEFICSFYEKLLNEKLEIAQKDVETSLKKLEKESKGLISTQNALTKNKSKISKAEKKGSKLEAKLNKYQNKINENEVVVNELNTKTTVLDSKISDLEKVLVVHKEELDKKKQFRDYLKTALSNIKTP